MNAEDKQSQHDKHDRDDRDDQDDRQARRDKLGLRLSCMVLAVVLAGLCVVRQKVEAWPVLTWPMYARREFPYPEQTDARSWLEVELSDARGGVLRERVEMRDLLPMGWDVSVLEITEAAFADEPRADARRSLVHMLGVRYEGRSVVAVELYRGVWELRPAALPPLDRDRPASTRLVGRFTVAQLGVDHGDAADDAGVSR